VAGIDPLDHGLGPQQSSQIAKMLHDETMQAAYICHVWLVTYRLCPVPRTGTGAQAAGASAAVLGHSQLNQKLLHFLGALAV
jgi:hypothetical protein